VVVVSHFANVSLTFRFRWVACQIDYLCELPTDAEKRKALKSLPPNLNQTYERILANVNQRGPAIQRIVKATLQWIVNSAERYIPAAALCEAISLKVGDTEIDTESAIDEETILLHCSCLVRQSATDDYLELAHFTVQEFLSQIKPDSPFSPYAQRPKEIQPLLARISLTYVIMDAFQHDVVETLAGWKQQQAMYPFRAHAVRFWVEYTQHSWEDNDLLVLAQQLFHPSKSLCFLSWARDYLYVCSEEYMSSGNDSQEAFSEVTKLICEGGVTPLHMAAALGSPGLCRWLLYSGCQVNQTSTLGTPLHCSLVGIEGFLDALNYTAWLETLGEYMSKGRTEVLEILIGNGSDLTASYRDPHGEEHSCAKLALHAKLGRGAKHPLITLVSAGAKLDKGLLTAFENLIDETEYDFDGHEEFVGILIKKLEESSEDDSIRTDLLTAALRFKSSTALVTISGERKGTPHLMNLSMEELQNVFHRAIRFDQTEIMEHLLQDRRLDACSLVDDDGKTPLHVAAQYEAVNAMNLLLSLGADVNATSINGATPLHFAAVEIRRTPDSICTLLDAGANIASVHSTTTSTAWHIAARTNNTIALKLLAARDPQKSISLGTCRQNGHTPLFEAAESKSESSFEFLLLETPEIPETLPNGFGLVHYVVQMNSIKLLRLLRSKGFPLNQIAKDGRTALHFIPEQVDPDIIRLLVESGVQPSSTSDAGATPLHRFIVFEISNDHEVFELLATKESLPLVAKSGYAALHFAVGFTAGSLTNPMDYTTRKLYVKWLVDKGADLDSRATNGKSCISLVVEAYARITEPHDSTTLFFEFLHSVIEGTNNVDLLNEEFPLGDILITPLCWAIMEGNESLAELLLERGVEVDMTCDAPASIESDNWSAIHFALFFGSSFKLFEQILKATKRLKNHDSRGYYLPHLACEEGSDAGIYHLERLCAADIDISLPSACPTGRTPLMLASQAGKLEHVEFLLNRTDFHARESDGWEAFHYAAYGDCPDILALFIGRDIDWMHSVDVSMDNSLLKNCNILHITATGDCTDALQWVLKTSLVADINCLNGDGMSALHLASAYGSVADVELLISSGAKIEIQSSSSLRPIHCAVKAGRLDVVRVLLSHGCLQVADSRGFTPELYALTTNEKDIVSLLRRWSSQTGTTDIFHYLDPSKENLQVLGLY
jgi:ankyrin repeat protein